MPTQALRPRKGPKTQRLAEQRLRRLMVDIDDDALPYEVERTIPEAWATLEQDIDVDEKRVPVTLRIDESVIKFYRAMGKGYQARINRVLATYAQMQIAQVRWFEGEMCEAGAQAGYAVMELDMGGTARRDEIW